MMCNAPTPSQHFLTYAIGDLSFCPYIHRINGYSLRHTSPDADGSNTKSAVAPRP